MECKVREVLESEGIKVLKHKEEDKAIANAVWLVKRCSKNCKHYEKHFEECAEKLVDALLDNKKC